jgi:hypothetical protein
MGCIFYGPGSVSGAYGSRSHDPIAGVDSGVGFGEVGDSRCLGSMYPITEP